MIACLFLLGRRDDARELAAFVPDCAVLFKRLLRDARVPRRVKAAVALLLLYLLMPFDLVPDFIPVAGQLDDAILVAVVLAYAARSTSPELIEELWPGSERALRVVLAFASAPSTQPPSAR